MLKDTKTSGKLKANFESEPYTVQSKDDSEVTVQSKDGVEYRRNSYFVKRYNLPEEAKESMPDVDPEAGRTAPVSELLEESAVASGPKRITRMPAKYKDFMLS